MNSSAMSAVQLFGRLLMALIFVRSGLFKVVSMDAVVGMLTARGLPMPGLTYFGVVAIEALGGLAVLTGFKTRPVALIMAAYCVATAFIAHWHLGNEPQLTHFYKNICMAGGFLQLYVLGGGTWSLDAKLRS